MKILGLSNRVKDHERNTFFPLAQLPQDGMVEYFTSMQQHFEKRGKGSFFPLIRSMLQLNPDLRPQSVQEIIKALKSMANGHT
jgi:hypothetical protein